LATQSSLHNQYVLQSNSLSLQKYDKKIKIILTIFFKKRVRYFISVIPIFFFKKEKNQKIFLN